MHAKSLGCLTIGLTCNHGSRLDKEPDISIVTDTGAEVITGSTRMKAGSAHKMVLNMISTCVMVKMGNVYQNLMINLKPMNIKLERRVVSIVCDIYKCDETKARELLDKYNWSIREVVDNEEIKQLKILNTQEGVPTFEEFLKEVDGKVPLLIEIKLQRSKQYDIALKNHTTSGVLPWSCSF